MRFVRELLPPLIPKAYHRLRRWRASPETLLFDGDNEMFKRVASRASVYGEYGVGASTDWVYANTSAQILAVDTSNAWAQSVMRGKDPKRISVTVPDCGPVGDWGRPIDYGFRENFAQYVEHLWKQGSKPDTLLIDGRFRVCCFATSVANADPGTKILFDDYNDRPAYHVVEEILKPVERCGRQALFEVAQDVDRSRAKALARDFKMVMD